MSNRFGLRIVSLLMAAALAATACTSGSDATTTTLNEATDTTSGGASTTSLDGGAPTTTPAVDDVDEALQAMCRSLDLLWSAGVPGPQAAAALWTVDLTGTSSTEQAAYGDLLVRAPRERCPQHIAYADDVAYWLGF